MGKLTTRQKILLGILSGLLIFLIYDTFVPDTPIPTGAPPPPGSSFDRPPAQVNVKKTSKAPVAKGGTAPATIQLKKFEGDWGGRDPFFRKIERIVVEEKQEEKLGLILFGVQWINGKAIAVINNNIYWEGDVVDGKKLAKVEKDYVVLREENKEYILRLGSEE